MPSKPRDPSRGRRCHGEFDVDLFVIGGGSGGVRAARIAAGYGAKVMVAEEYRLGGTCVIRGCVPKKLMVYGSHVHQEIEDAAGFGWTVPRRRRFDWPTLIANKDKEIARLEGIYTANVEKTGAQDRQDPRRARRSRIRCVCRTGKTVTAKHILIATGGAPNHGPAIPGIEHVISSNEAFHLHELPRRIVIQGGGYIALEFAGIFARLRLRRDRDLSRRQHPARLRRGRARPMSAAEMEK